MKKSLLLAPIFLLLFTATTVPPSHAADCIFYQNSNRGGSWWEAYAYEAASFDGLWWNDRISSVWVRPGYRARIYQDSHFSGGAVAFDGSSGGIPTPDGGRYWNLGATWNDRASSIVCESVYDSQGPACTVYQNSDGSGASWAVSEGQYVYSMGDWNDRISDVNIADDHVLVVFADSGLTGASTTFHGCTSSGDVRLCPWYDLHAMGWGDRISSFMCLSD
jgi:hypothetical protein